MEISESFAGQGFGQKRPPLYHLIKNILRDYPSGQVFKVYDYHQANKCQYCLSASELNFAEKINE